VATTHPLDASLPNALQAGLEHHQAGRLPQAETIYQRILKVAPNHPDALHLSGLIASQTGDSGTAVDLINKAISANPYDPFFYNNLGNALKAQGKLDEAVENYRKALSLKPDYFEAHYNLGIALQAQYKLDEAIASYRKAISLNPDSALAHNNLGNALQSGGKLDEAVESYRKALSLDPDYAEARYNLGNALQSQGRLDEVVACYELAQSLEPTRSEWALRQLGVMPLLADSRADIAKMRSRLSNDTDRLLAQPGSVGKLENAQFTLFSLAYHGAADKPLMENVARLVRAKAPALTRSLVHRPPPVLGDGRIRVGFLSSFLHNHTVGKLTQGYIRNLDRKRFHVTVIHTSGAKIDDVHIRMNSMADAVVRLSSGLESAQREVAALSLDVLQYPDIGMSSFTYFLAYARLAPVQTVSWGHPVTTGLDSIDYFLSFGAAEPQEAETHYTETLLRLDRAPAYYEPIDVPPQVASRAALGLPDRGNLYGCLQSLFKFHPDFDAVLAGIIERDPQGWIIVIEGNRAHLRDQLRNRWAVSYPALLERVIFMPRRPQDAFMMLLAQMDVLLDTPHFGSGNTLYESMAFGVPTITWPGEFMRGRLVAGMYRWLGIIDAPVASALDAYVPLAVAYATDRDRREALKQQLMERAPAIYQDDLAVRELEAFLEQAVAAARRDEQLSHWSAGLPWPAQSPVDRQVSAS
jgi:predicted O-linked N-acetylglucosamine transferase (SPINDLY family)